MYYKIRLLEWIRQKKTKVKVQKGSKKWRKNLLRK